MFCRLVQWALYLPSIRLGGKSEKEIEEPLLLSLCVHADLDTQIIAISNEQLKLLHAVSLEVRDSLNRCEIMQIFVIHIIHYWSMIVSIQLQADKMRSKLLDFAHLLLYTNEELETDQEVDLGTELIEEDPKAEEHEEWKKKKNRSVAEGA